MERVRAEEHQGRRIVVVDGTDVPAEEYADVLRRGAAFIAREPPGSVLLATVVKNARFGLGAADRVKEYSLAIRPYVKASAVVGLSPLQQVIYFAVKPFLHGSVTAFPDLASAKEWLARRP